MKTTYPQENTTVHTMTTKGAKWRRHPAQNNWANWACGMQGAYYLAKTLLAAPDLYLLAPNPHMLASALHTLFLSL